MAKVAESSKESSVSSFLLTVVCAILIAGYALYAFGIFPFNTWFNSDDDLAKVEVNQNVPLQAE